MEGTNLNLISAPANDPAAAANENGWSVTAFGKYFSGSKNVSKQEKNH